MEDAHIAKFDIAPDVHVFGVFDGHGGNYTPLSLPLEFYYFFLHENISL